MIERDLHQRRVSLGSRAAEARPGMQEFRSDAVVEPMPRATSCTWAPTFSERSAISLMKVILVARNASAAYRSVPWAPRRVHRRRLIERQRPTDHQTLRARSSDVPPRAVRELKSRIAAPSRRNSGFEAITTSAEGLISRIRRSTSSPVPTGTDDFVATTVKPQRRGDLARRGVDISQVGMAVAAPRRRADRDEHRIGLGDRRRQIGGKIQALALTLAATSASRPGSKIGISPRRRPRSCRHPCPRR